MTGMAVALRETSTFSGSASHGPILQAARSRPLEYAARRNDGRIVRIVTERTTLDGHTVNASHDDPHFEVESNKSGKRAVHKGDALKRISH